MTKKYEIVSINDTVLANVTDGLELDLMVNEHGTYELQNFNEYIDMLSQLEEGVKSYVFSEEDRGDIRTLGAQINKINDEIKTEIKERESYLFGKVQEQRKQLEERLKSLRAEVVRGRDEQDEQDKKNKYERLEKRFEDMKFHMSNLTESDLKFSHVFESRWLNRSMSENKVDDTLESRMSSVDAVMGSSLLTEDVTVDVVVQALMSTEWDGLRAITQIDEDITRRRMQEEEAEIARRVEEEKRKEREEKLKNEEISKKQYEKEIGLTKIQVTILQKDLKRVEELLQEHDIEYSTF